MDTWQIYSHRKKGRKMQAQILSLVINKNTLKWFGHAELSEFNDKTKQKESQEDLDGCYEKV